jgi:diguanylate cyclase (GGDEF)-like protein
MLARLILPVGIGVLLLLAAAVGGILWSLREDAITASRQTADNFAMMLAVQIERSVQGMDIVLRELQDQVAAEQASTPADPDAGLGTPALHAWLVSRLERLPQAAGITVVGRDGMMRNTTRAWPAPSIDLSDRPYFKYFADHPKSGLFVSAPLANRADGAWTVLLVRRITSSNGRFGGLVIAGLRLPFFEKALGEVALPRGGSFLLARRDGTVLLRFPDTTGPGPLKIPADSPWYSLAAGNGGTYRTPGYFDGVARQVAVRPIADYALVVDIAISEAATFARWYRLATEVAGFSALLLLPSVLLLVLLRRQVLRQERARAGLAQTNQDLTRATARLHASRQDVASQSAMLETILNTMDQGLMMIDANRRVAVCNRQAMNMLDLPPELMARRPGFEEVLAHQWRSDEFAQTEMDVQSFIRAGGLLDRAHVYERRRPDGRVMEVRSVPQPGGGVVRTYTDITSRRDAEDRIRHIALHDHLTQLSNRAAFNQQLQTALSAGSDRGRSLAVLYLDLDLFKQVNDTHGHEAGDMLLTQVAGRMRAAVRAVDTVARMGGDEFAIIQLDADLAGGTMALANRLLAEVSAPYKLGDVTVEIGVSIGISWYPVDGVDAETLLRHADAALYIAKREGRNRVRAYSGAMAAGPVPTAD